MTAAETHGGRGGAARRRAGRHHSVTVALLRRRLDELEAEARDIKRRYERTHALEVDGRAALLSHGRALGALYQEVERSIADLERGYATPWEAVLGIAARGRQLGDAANHHSDETLRDYIRSEADAER